MKDGNRSTCTIDVCGHTAEVHIWQGEGLRTGTCLSELFAAPPVRDSRGRIRIPGGPKGLGLSHTRGVLVAAICPTASTGVDAEWLARPVPGAPLAARWFSPKEAEDVAAAPDHFLRLWTAKEAAAKACGLGLARSGAARDFPAALPLSRWRGHLWATAYVTDAVPGLLIALVLRLPPGYARED